jgi:hypothetical protein
VRLTVRNAPWYRTGPASSWADLEQILVGSWSEAAIEFYAERVAKSTAGKKAPKGVQPFLNSVLERRFSEAGWDGDAGGRFWTEDRWVRITFRHQMSLGSDFTDALKVSRKSGFNEVMIAAATGPFLTLISPNDAKALTSYEKVWDEAVDLEGCLDIPLLLGSLQAVSPLPSEVAAIVHASRPRDVYGP